MSRSIGLFEGLSRSLGGKKKTPKLKETITPLCIHGHISDEHGTGSFTTLISNKKYV